MIKKKVKIISLVFILLLLVACQSESTSVSPEVDEKKENSKQENNRIGDEKTIDLTLEAMKKQVAGTLVQDPLSNYQLEKMNNASALQLEYLDEVVSELENLIISSENPKEIYEGIVYLFGSPNYKELIEKAEDFEPQFDEPELLNIREGQSLDIEFDRGKTIILLDANTKMAQTVDGKKQMEIVKEAINPFVKMIGQTDDIALIVYGHHSHQLNLENNTSCDFVEEIYPLGTLNAEKFEHSLTTFDSFGESPLAKAIQKATELSNNAEDVSLYIISKESETCGGDPLIEVENFVEGYSNRYVHIIGFDVDQEVEEHLKKLAFSGKGTYYFAENEEDIISIIESKWLQSFIDLVLTHTKAPGPWEILDEYNRFDTILNQIRDSIKKEKLRFDQAIQIMRMEVLTSGEVIDQVSMLINENYRKKLEILSEFRSEKLNEIDKKAENIRYRIEAWKEEVKQLDYHKN